MRRYILAVFALTVLVACQPATTEFTEEQKDEIAAEVSTLHDEWVNALAAADFDRGMSLMYNSPDAAWGFEGEIDFGYDAIDARWRPFFDNTQSQDITVQEMHIEVLAPTVACINEIVTATATDTSGVAGPELVYAITTVWVLRDGQWKMYFGHESLPTPETM